MKSAKKKDFIPPSEYDPDTLFTMVHMEENKSEKLGPQEVGKGIADIPLDEFLDCLNCAKEDAVWKSFRMNDLVSKSKRRKRIGTKKKYAVFTGIMKRPETRKTVYLRLANSEKNNEDEKEDNEDEEEEKPS